MHPQLFIKTAFCSEYMRLLEECQNALKIWNERREEIYQSGLRAKKFDDELRQLQAKYASALTLAQKHAHDCPPCQFVLRIGEDDSENNSNNLSEKVFYAC